MATGPRASSGPSAVFEASSMEKGLTKIKDLTVQTKQANVLAKVLNVGERREVQSKFGGPRELAEAVVGDDTGTIILTLWGDQIGSIAKDETVFVENGFVSLVRGHMRLNCGKYGHLSKSEASINDVNANNDMSAVEYQQERRRSDDRPREGGPTGYGFGGSEFSFRGRDHRRDFSRDRRKDKRRGRDRW